MAGEGDAPEAKKIKVENSDNEEEDERRILAQLVSETGDPLGTPFDLQLNITSHQLQLVTNALLQQESTTPYQFFVDDKEIKANLGDTLDKKKDLESEKVVQIVYQALAVFKVRPVTRCSSSIEGHAEAVISVQFSPNGRYLASGSGDKTVRFWDLTTETPHHVCSGHSHWVLCIAWSPDCKKLASACKNSQIMVWDPETGKQKGRTMTGHKQWINWVCWKPLHLDPECRYLVSASKDSTVRIWDTVLGQCKVALTSHTQSVTCVRWGGSDLIYTGSQDRTVKVWRSDGTLCRSLQGHGHWINNLALNTDYAIRTGAFDPAKATLVPVASTDSLEEMKKKALDRYNAAKRGEPERLVSCSDDFTMFLWTPETDKKPVTRMTGHQQLINHVVFSPDGRLVASASFDKSVKIWNGRTGQYIASLRGHVQRVYQVAWSADSRMLCSGSADSTLKLFDMKEKKLLNDLPGHADEVYAVDWSPDGQRVASGGKDKVLKIWRK